MKERKKPLMIDGLSFARYLVITYIFFFLIFLFHNYIFYEITFDEDELEYVSLNMEIIKQFDIEKVSDIDIIVLHIGIIFVVMLFFISSIYFLLYKIIKIRSNIIFKFKNKSSHLIIFLFITPILLLTGFFIHFYLLTSIQIENHLTIGFYFRKVVQYSLSSGLIDRESVSDVNSSFEIIHRLYLIGIYALHISCGISLIIPRQTQPSKNIHTLHISCHTSLIIPVQMAPTEKTQPSVDDFRATYQHLLGVLILGAAFLVAITALSELYYALPSYLLEAQAAKTYLSVATKWSNYFGLFNSLLIAAICLPTFAIFRHRLRTQLTENNLSATEKEKQDWLIQHGFNLTVPKVISVGFAIASPFLSSGPLAALLRIWAS